MSRSENRTQTFPFLWFLFKIVAGLEPAILGTEFQRLIHWATRPCSMGCFLMTYSWSSFDNQQYSRIMWKWHASVLLIMVMFLVKGKRLHSLLNDKTIKNTTSYLDYLFSFSKIDLCAKMTSWSKSKVVEIIVTINK